LIYLRIWLITQEDRLEEKDLEAVTQKFFSTAIWLNILCTA